MTIREKILCDPLDYTAEELFDCICNKEISYEEIMNIVLPDKDENKQFEDCKDKLEKIHIDWEWPQIQNTRNIEELEKFKGRHCRKEKDYTHIFKLCDERIKRLKEEILFNSWNSPEKRIVEKINNLKKDKAINDVWAEFVTWLKTKTILDPMDPNYISVSILLDMIKKDHNIFPAYAIHLLLEDKIIKYTDLIQIGINEKFLHFMYNNPPESVDINLPEPNSKLESIPDGYTEFYFWGIPASGKTCALGGIMSAANSGEVCSGMECETDSQGYGYMKALTAVFKEDEVCLLPGGTAVKNTYEMRFKLTGRFEKTDENGKKKYDTKIYPCALIDLAGELFVAIHQKLSNSDLNDDQTDALAALEKILVTNRSKNSKIHFFVIEYGAEDREYNEFTQQTYLDSCVDYIRDKGIFKDNTDRVYILVTKADKFDTSKIAESDVLIHYIKSHYLGFYKKLKEICTRCEINNGKPGMIAYSIGDVCFQNYCLFDPGKSEGVVYDCLLDTVYGQSSGKFGSLRNGLSK